MKNLFEEVGVPKNIEKAGEKLYHVILTELKKTSVNEINTKTHLDLDFNTNLVIGNEDNKQLTITDINLKVDFNELNHDKIVLLSAGYNPRPEMDKERWLLINDNDPKELFIRLSFGYPDSDFHITDFSDIINYYETNSLQIISTLTHELKHAYDFYVKPHESLKDFSHYMGITNANRYGIQTVTDFLHLLYLATKTEIIVKPSELYSQMTMEGIDKKNFLEFLLNNDTYLEFKKMREYTLDDLINGIRKESNGAFSTKRALQGVYTSMAQYELNTASGFATDFFEDMYYQISQVKSKGHEFLEKYHEELIKYQDDPIKYFQTQIKNLNEIGDYMIRKIGKLYSIASENTDSGDIIRKIYNKSNPQVK